MHHHAARVSVEAIIPTRGLIGFETDLINLTRGEGVMSHRAPRVGLFGLLGSGNIGNDASTEALMAYLRTDHPDAEIDAMCMGWAQMRERYGIEAIPFQWQQTHQRPGQNLRKETNIK